MRRSAIIGLVVIAAVAIAPIVYVVANYYLPTALTQTFAQPNIEICTQSSSANITYVRQSLWYDSKSDHYELYGANVFIGLINRGDVDGYAKVAFYLLGVEQHTHTVFVKAHSSVFDSVQMQYPNAPIILTYSDSQKYYLNYKDAEAKIISQWKA